MKVQASRIENGVEVCNTCGKPVNQPYRFMVKGEDGYFRTVEGCVSRSHNNHVFDSWHLSKVAQKIRKDILLREEAL